MNPDREQFLDLATKPARLSVEEAAWYLGFNPVEISLLIALGMIPVCGRPAKNGRKFVPLVQAERLRTDAAFLSKASDAIVKYHQRRNSRRKLGDEVMAV